MNLHCRPYGVELNAIDLLHNNVLCAYGRVPSVGAPCIDFWCRGLKNFPSLSRISSSISSRRCVKTNSIVATSLAIVMYGFPALGQGTLATTSRSSFMVIEKVILFVPPGYFSSLTQWLEPTADAATLASSCMLKRTYL